MALSNEQRKEAISAAYLRAISAYEFCSVASWEHDMHGVDLQICIPPDPNYDGDFNLAFQLKCTSSTSKYNAKKDSIHWDLRVKQYNKLAGRTNVPRVLVVALLPETQSPPWVAMSHSVDQLIVQGRAWYRVMTGARKSTNNEYQRVHLEHRLDFKAFRELCQLVAGGQRLRWSETGAFHVLGRAED